MKLVIGIIPYVLLICKHDTVLQIVIAVVLLGTSVGAVLVSQMVRKTV